MRPARIAFVIGTRPEAIKLSPVVHALAAERERPLLIVTGQHPGLELADHGLESFQSVPLCCTGLPDPIIHADLVRMAMVRVLGHHRPDMIVVQGDTSSALGGALAARECGCLLAHVEAGLRSHDPQFPWPEEHNRQQIDRIADLLFAPTGDNAANLRNEQVGGEIHVTGNSGIDALAARLGGLPVRKRWPIVRSPHFRLLVTCHRRENWGEGVEGLTAALAQLASDRGMRIEVVLPPNPTVAEAISASLADVGRINVLPPLSHDAMIAHVRRCDLLLSDSGGLQEEAPALGVPMLVMRRKTERPESIASGNAMLAPAEPDALVKTIRDLRRDRKRLARMGRPAMPFGDGRAAARIAALMLEYLSIRHEDAQAERCA